MTDDEVSPVDWQAATPKPTMPFPGRKLGIIGFVLSFVAPFNVAGLVISIIALIRSKRSGNRNDFALAGLLIAIVGILFTVVCLVVIGPPLIAAAHTCAHLGYGVHIVGNSTYTCTPTSIDVRTAPQGRT